MAGNALQILHLGKYFAPFKGGLENYMRDLMVACARRGISSAALVHRHHWSLRSREETIELGGFQFQVVRAGRIAHLLFSPISPGFALQLYRMVKLKRPDCIHIHLPNPSAFWVLFFARVRRVPWVVHWHSDVITESQSWPLKLMYLLYRPFESAVLKRAAEIVVTSPNYRDASRPLRQWKSKCTVVPLGIDIEKFNTETSLESDQRNTFIKNIPVNNLGPLRVLAAGRLTYYKGFKYLFEAAARVENVQIDLVGVGDEAQALENLARSLSLQDRVFFHGAVSDRELIQYLRQCDCLCLPSIERSEAFGMVLLEAMYCGKATISSDIPGSGMNWIVDDGVTGLKVEPGNVNALADALSRMDNERDELVHMGQRGKEKFSALFEIGQSVEELIAVYSRATSMGQQLGTADE
jgi:rhamnosyl/mannosyltransferase